MVLLVATVFVGLTDDESYYWVLAQKPALGYAYHPPMIAWMIFVSQKIFGGIFGPSSSFVVRFLSCSCMGVLVALSLDWIRRAAAPRAISVPRAALALLSFAGVFGLGWMMVPDVPLFLGWMLAFYSSWRIAFESRERRGLYVLLAVGVVFSILGKYSGILVPVSVLISLLAGPEGFRRFWKSFAACALGSAVALVPILIWNSQHEWLSILYQIQERHHDSEISVIRYLRFWLIELLAVGPVLLAYCFALVYRAFYSKSLATQERANLRFVVAWVLPPALIYCTQPLISDFKPHWAFIVWLPGALAFAWEVGTKGVRFARGQILYGLSLITIVLVGLHVPVMSLVIHHFKGPGYDSRWDPTNDLYGWNRFADYARSHPRSDGTMPYVVASRYQTASRAAAALGSIRNVSLLPRGLSDRDEWPVLPVSDKLGPEWPELLQPVLYVGDNRFDAPPEYKRSQCESPVALDTFRDGLLAKKILIWPCRPVQ